MVDKTYFFKIAHTDGPTGLQWPGGAVDRVGDSDGGALQGRLEAATGPSGQRVVIDLGADFIEKGELDNFAAVQGFDPDNLPAVNDFDPSDGPYLNEFNPSGPVRTFLAQANQANMRTNGLGAGASGDGAFVAASADAFLAGAGVSITLGSVAVGAVASVYFPSTVFGMLVGWTTSNGMRGGSFVARTGGATNLACVLIGQTASNNGATYDTGAPPTGTTGNNGTVNFYAGNDNRLYVENRYQAVTIILHILRYHGGASA